MSGSVFLIGSATRERVDRRVCCAVILSAVLGLSGCNGTEALYESGPWRRPQVVVEGPPLYAPPSNQILVEWASTPAPASLPARQRPAVSKSATEQMEPLGFKNRRAQPVSPRTSAATPEDLAADRAPRAPVTARDPLPAPRPATPTQTQIKPLPPSSRPVPATLAGNWTIRTGATACRLQLSSVAALDLFKAYPSRCDDEALQQINSWSIVDGILLLYARGAVVARMPGDGASFSGMLSGSGRLLTLTR